MKGAITVFRKDWLELTLNWRALALNLLLPPLLVLLVGMLRTQPTAFRLIVAGVPQQLRQRIGVLEDLSSIQVTVRDQPVADPLAEIRRNKLDLVANFNDAKGPGWTLYTAETDAFRLRALRAVIPRIRDALEVIAADPSSGASDRAPEKKDVRPLIRILADPAPQGLFSYFPQAEMPNSLMPEMTALVVCFLPFTLAAPGLVRERESRVLEVLLVAPRISSGELFAGKCLYPATAALVVFALCLILVQSAYGLHVKSGFLIMMLFLGLAVLSATFMGMTVSALVATHSQALFVCGILFFGFTMLSGFLYPVTSESSAVVWWLSRLFPLTFVHPVLKPWMYGAPPPDWTRTWFLLLAQTGAYGATSWMAFRRMMRRV